MRGAGSDTYTKGQLSAVADCSSVTTSYTFDDQGRIATHEGDDGGLNAVTSYSYDLWGRTATVTAPADIIDKVTSRGTDNEQSNNFRGEITNANQPNALAYVRNMDSYLTTSNDNSLGNVFHWSTMFGERYKKRSLCNQRETHYYYSPFGPGGASHELRLLDMFDSCVSEYPRHYRTFIYLEGRPIAVLHSQIASSSNNAQLGNETYWVHVDHLGTPVLVTQSDRTDRWHWENDPFGRADPIEYTLASQDVNPDDTPAYGTCGSGTQCSIWSKTYSVTGAQNIRVHFSAFSVAPGSNRTAKDYVRLYKTDGTTVIDDLTGNLGAHWSPWSGAGESAMTVDFIADNSVDLGYSGFTIDKLEYASAANGRYVMHLRMPGQIWDDDAKASYNYQRWYRPPDGRYASPDPIGRVGGEAGYFAYAGSNPVSFDDPSGLLPRRDRARLPIRERQGRADGSSAPPPPPDQGICHVLSTRFSPTLQFANPPPCNAPEEHPAWGRYCTARWLSGMVGRRVACLTPRCEVSVSEPEGVAEGPSFRGRCEVAASGTVRVECTICGCQQIACPDQSSPPSLRTLLEFNGFLEAGCQCIYGPTSFGDP